MFDDLLPYLNRMLILCPACHGVGKVLSNGREYLCLVCEDVQKAVYIYERNCNSHEAKIAWLDKHRPDIDRVLSRCPSCFGVKSVYTDGVIRPCLVCSTVHSLLYRLTTIQSNDIIILRDEEPNFME